MTAGRRTATHGFAGEQAWGYSQAIVAGGLVHVAGQVPRDEHEVPMVAPLPASFARAFDLLEDALGQVGGTAEDLIHVHLFMREADVAEGAALFSARLGHVGAALTLTVVNGLNHPDYALEVSATALAPSSERSPSMKRESVTTGHPVDERPGRAPAVRAGELIYVAAQPSVGPDGNAIEDPSFVAHYEQAFTNFRRVVEAAGGSGETVLSTHTFVIEPVPEEQASQVAEIHRRMVGSGQDKPASTLVHVAALSTPNAKVEVMGVALVAPKQ